MAPGSRTLRDLALVACAVALCGSAVTGNREIGDVGQTGQGPDFHDSHFHLTNYIQEGTDVRRFLQIMGTLATSRRLITCSRTRRSITTPSPMPTSPASSSR